LRGNEQSVTKDNLQPAQLRALAATTARQRDYLMKLRARMEALKFSTDDALYSAVCRAFSELSNLTVVAASTATRGEAARSQTIMERKPWAG